MTTLYFSILFGWKTFFTNWVLMAVLASFALTANAQPVSDQSVLTSRDSLMAFFAFESHLWHTKGVDFQRKLISPYRDGENGILDSVIFFLIADHEEESQGDGEFRNMQLHRASLMEQPNPQWIEITEFEPEGDYFNLRFVLKQTMEQSIRERYSFRYRARRSDADFLWTLSRQRIRKFRTGRS